VNLVGVAHATPVLVIGVLLLVFGLMLGAVVGRRYLLGRSQVSFDCALRKQANRGGWMLGVARYGTDRLEWFRIFTLTFKPRRVFSRALLEVTDRRTPTDAELDSILPGSLVVRCRYGVEAVEFAMSEQSYAGFATWLESAPPGLSPLTHG
jgi:hypothetical protein